MSSYYSFSVNLFLPFRLGMNSLAQQYVETIYDLLACIWSSIPLTQKSQLRRIERTLHFIPSFVLSLPSLAQIIHTLRDYPQEGLLVKTAE